MVVDIEKYYASELHNISLRKYDKFAAFKESLTLTMGFFAGLTVAFALSFIVSLMLLSGFVFVATLLLRILIGCKFKKFVECEVSEFQTSLGELDE